MLIKINGEEITEKSEHVVGICNSDLNSHEITEMVCTSMDAEYEWFMEIIESIAEIL